MSDEIRFVVLTEAGTTFDAQLIAGAIKAHGIPCVTSPDGPLDEFTMSQHMRGQGIQVLVPSDRVDEAREILAELRDSARETEETPWNQDVAPEAPAKEDRSGWSTLTVLSLAAIILVLGWMQLQSMRENEIRDRDDPTLSLQVESEGWSYRRKSTGLLQSSWFDRDGNGTCEEWRFFDTEGRLLSTSYDRDQDGVSETGSTSGPDGNLICTWWDENQNERTERMEFVPVDGVLERWRDVDEDGRFDSIELVSEADGTVVKTLVRKPGAGFVPGE